MATLVGLEYAKNREIARHNRETERQAERDRLSKEGIAASDRHSKESIAHLDRSSRESVSSADRTSRENIATLDRLANEENSRYATDMNYLGRTANPIANTIMSSAIVSDRIGSDNWSSQQSTSPLRDLVTSTIRSADQPIGWTQDSLQQLSDEVVEFIRPLLDPKYESGQPLADSGKSKKDKEG